MTKQTSDCGANETVSSAKSGDKVTSEVPTNMVELYVDTDICVGMGLCEVIEPTVFEINDDAISVVIGSALFPADRADKVMLECPSGAIKARS